VDGKTGYTFRTDDVNDLAEKMQWIAIERNNSVEYARYCVERMKNFTPDKAAEQILNGCKAIFDKTGTR
jgi:hypothetical protein